MKIKQKIKIYLKSMIIPIILFVFVLFLSVGYSELSNNLTMSQITAIVRVDKDIRITGLTFNSLEKANITYSEYNHNSISVGLNLKKSDSYAILNVEITNLGNAVQALTNISNLNPELEYEFMSDYELGDIICDNSNKCYNGIKKNLLIKIKYKDDKYNSNSTLYNLKMDFAFNDFVKVEFDDNIKNYIKNEKDTIVRTGTYKVEIENIFIDDIYVYSKDSFLTRYIDYEIVDGYLIVYNVTDDLYIKTRDYLKTDIISKNEISVEAKWIDDINVELILNGKLNSELYLRLRREDLYIGDKPSDLYKSEYVNNPLFSKNQKVYISYKYLGGNYNLNGAFTIKFRDATKSSTAFDDCAFITNHAKENFSFEVDETKICTLSKDVSVISLYSNSGSTFDNVRIIVSYGTYNE